jgi:UDP-N-acetylmuramoyl-L-alanyl-D-glutamate--2,6-diaminopimelate ligase
MTVKQLFKAITPPFLLKTYHYALALLGALIYGFPSQKLTVIGITGTSGKSTTVDFVTRIFEENGDAVASISSVRFKIGQHEWQNGLKMTMPGRLTIQKFLRQAVQAQCKYVVLEITSEGIRQFRHKFITIDMAVFTNLSPEHIESHGGFENYRNEKLKLFKAANNVHVINVEDQNAQHFLDVPAKKLVTFGLHRGDVNEQNTPIKLKLLGDFNRYNALAAVAVAKHYSVSLDVCRRALEKVTGIPGRMEVISSDQPGKPLVIVDYAHTPEQLELTYKSLNSRPLVCVFGSCGGGRDKWKRPVLGNLAQQYCSQIIITDEDPYDEDPLEIMEQVAGGIDSQQKNYRIIVDRREAIKSAIAMATPSETVIITGKGSENLLCLADGKKIPWSDANIAKEALKM